MKQKATHGYAPINGLNLYYEIHGAGQPLLLMGGGFMTIDALGPLLPALAATRQVIAVELEGHGHTADPDRPLRFEQMADDIAALIEHLKLDRTDLFGYSLGGGVALQTAIRHPGMARRLVVMSAPFKRSGWYPETLAGMAAITPEGFAGTPPYEAYLRSAPDPDHWPAFVAKVRQLLGEDYDWSADVAALKAPILIVIGDADGISPAHAAEMFGLLGGGQMDGFARGRPPSQLAILPGATHLDMVARTDLLLSNITPFLDAPIPADA